MEPCEIRLERGLRRNALNSRKGIETIPHTHNAAYNLICRNALNSRKGIETTSSITPDNLTLQVGMPLIPVRELKLVPKFVRRLNRMSVGMPLIPVRELKLVSFARNTVTGILCRNALNSRKGIET